ncbi:SCP2 sterol-binding domain-containing protein [Saccharopolyspora spinosa]|nr:SCP2 sterol-binding domain-containing protein [Saccharopolyspora spinosa]
MSQEHIEAMNDLLARSKEVAAAAAELPREYVLVYELTDGPVDGATVHWQLRFSPGGTTFALTPAPDADVVLRGDWRAALTAMEHSRRTGQPADDGLTTDGDIESLMAAIGKQFAIARKVATLETTFPD